MDLAKQIAKNIKKKRNELGWSQQQAADKLGCSLRNYQSLETKEGSNYRLSSLISLSQLYKCSVTSLFDGADGELDPRRKLIKKITGDLSKLEGMF